MSHRPACLLLVEDSTEDEFLILRAWRQAALDVRITIARDGQQALDLLFGSCPQAPPTEPRPDLVVLDLNLPRVGGFEVLERIRADERTALIPVVILTSSDDPVDCARCYQLGANSFVPKPVDAHQFRDAITRLGQYWTQSNLPAAP